MQASAPGFRAALDGLPHHQVVRSQVLIRVVRGSELVKRPGAPMKEHGGGHYPLLHRCARYKPRAASKHMPGDVFEEPERLRRHAMALSAQAVQGVKGPHGFERGGEFHLQVGCLRLPNAPSHRRMERCVDLLSRPCEINDMAMEGQRGSCARPFSAVAPALKIAPTPLLPPSHRRFVEACVIASSERPARVRKRERDAAPGCPKAGHLHCRQHRLQPVPSDMAKVTGPMPISIVQHAGPGPPMEERALAVRRQKGIPVRKSQRIERLDSPG